MIELPREERTSPSILVSINDKQTKKQITSKRTKRLIDGWIRASPLQQYQPVQEYVSRPAEFEQKSIL